MKWYDSEISKGIMQKKYFHEGEDVFSFIDRVCSIYSPEVKEKLHEALLNADFCPAGRILYGAGSKGKFKATMSNCFILPSPKEDSIEGIFNLAREMARTFSYGGGVGTTISTLRPKGARTNNSAKTSTGAVSFMNVLNEIGNVIGSNGRRSATMMGLDCTHPDLLEFLEIKENETKLASMNISILFTDEFMQAVCNHDKFVLHFYVPETDEDIVKEIDAYDFFTRFCKVNADWGDPGALFKDRMQKYNLLSGYPEYKINISNPCVTADTLILTDSGHKKIVDIVGKKTRVWNGFEWSVVSPKITGYNQKMLRVRVSNGMSLDCTRYHKFILSNGKRVKAEDLHVGDKLEKWNYPIIKGGIDDNGHDAYTNGFYSGDGTSGVPEIVLYGEKNKVIDRLNVRRISHRDDSTLVVLNERPLGKSYVPSNDMSVKYRLDWLAGLIDSDGTMNDSSGSIAITSINRTFLHDVQMMLTTLGCHSSINVSHTEADKELPRNDGTGETKLYHCQTAYRLTISAWYTQMLLMQGMELSRVHIEASPNRNASRFITITGIEEIPDANVVYCFNEPINHSGIFNGIMTAQCGEYIGNDYNSCLLSSINLYNIVENKFTSEASVNYAKLESLVRLGINVLDETLDYGLDLLPLPEQKQCAIDWRAIGLGVFGLADMFVAMGIKYGSKESIELVSELFDFINAIALDESSNLAHKYGTFAMYDWEKTKESPMIKSLLFNHADVYNKIKEFGLRNGTVLSIAPTGTISLLMGGFSGGVEPLFKLCYERTTHSMEDKGQKFRVFSKSVQDFLTYHNIPLDTDLDALKKEYPFLVESHEVNPLERVHLQSTMQEYIDNAISSTVNLPSGTPIKTIYDIYVEAWKQGCKGITVFVDGCKRGSILGVTPKKSDTVVAYDSIVPVSRRTVDEIAGVTYRVKTACSDKMYVTINKTPDGDIFEVFVNSSGGCVANLSTITRQVSTALRGGIKVEKILKDLSNTQCPACQALRRKGDADVALSCGNAIADCIKKAYSQKSEDNPKGFIECPECHKKTLKLEAHCCTCSNCGYSTCN